MAEEKVDRGENTAEEVLENVSNTEETKEEAPKAEEKTSKKKKSKKIKRKPKLKNWAKSFRTFKTSTCVCKPSSIILGEEPLKKKPS